MKNSISSTEGSKKWQITLAKIFNWCFLIAMVLVLGCSIVFISGNDNLKHFNRFFMMSVITLAIAIGATLIYTTFRFFNNRSDKWNHRVQIINWILIIISAFLIAYTVQMKIQVVDADFCIRTAKLLAPTMNWSDIPYGNLHYGYFYALIRCYNLAPLIFLEAFIFKFCSTIGINLTYSGFVAIGTYVNALMLLIAMFLAFRLIQKHCNISTQTGFSFILLINIPLFAMVYNIYTDIPALLSIMIILATYDTFIHANNTKSKAIYIFIIILASIIGALFKFNVLIALFAIIIHYFLTHNWKHNIKFILLLLIPTMLGLSGIKRAITVTSPVPQSELGLPATNWINMSFSKVNINGGYNGKYFDHTLNLKNKNDNKQVSQIEFKEFIKKFQKNPSLFFYIVYRKLGATYGNGSYDFNSLFVKSATSHSKMKNSFLGSLIYGKLNKLSLYGSAFLQLSLFLFIFSGAVLYLKRRFKISFILPFMITFFGNMLLLVFWETRSRYLLAFIGVIYVIACFGIEQLLNSKSERVNK